jgi:hypothetical protein
MTRLEYEVPIYGLAHVLEAPEIKKLGCKPYLENRLIIPRGYLNNNSLLPTSNGVKCTGLLRRPVGIIYVPKSKRIEISEGNIIAGSIGPSLGFATLNSIVISQICSLTQEDLRKCGLPTNRRQALESLTSINTSLTQLSLICYYDLAGYVPLKNKPVKTSLRDALR